MAERPPVLLSYFELKDLRYIVAAARSTGLAERANLSIGNYGVSVATAARIRELPGARYAPMLALRPTHLWDARPGAVGPRARRAVPRPGPRGGTRRSGNGHVAVRRDRGDGGALASPPPVPARRLRRPADGAAPRRRRAAARLRLDLPPRRPPPATHPR